MNKADHLEQQYSRAMAELLAGHPGCFLTPNDCQAIDGIDPEYGLPVESIGCVSDGPWVCAYNRGVRDYIREHGLPWNSRLQFLEELADVKKAFDRRKPEAIRLELAGPMFRPKGCDFALGLDADAKETWVELWSGTLFKKREIIWD